MATDHIYRLTEVLRHDGAVLNLATATRQLERGRAPFLPATGGGSQVITYPTLTQWKAAAIDYASSPEAQADTDFTRILCWTNTNVVSLNRLVHERLFGIDATPFMPGERIISHEAIPDPDGGSPLVHSTTEMVIREVYPDAIPLPGDEIPEVAIASHGIRRFKAGHLVADPWACWCITAHAPSIGTVEFKVLDHDDRARWKKCVKALDEKAKATRDRFERKALWRLHFKRKDAFGQVEPAAALTIHKSQGSTYNHVFLHPDVDGFSKKPSTFHNRLAYVGITRASKTLHVVADQEVNG
jgi:exodeoxyribonuclease-5